MWKGWWKFSHQIQPTNTSDCIPLRLIHRDGSYIDLLLVLARSQKVDLSEISISDLADQYIKFINQYRNINIEIAADYLVMSAWLTYLKSRLLLPKEEYNEDYSAEDLEKALRYQLQRLEFFQKKSKELYSRPIVNRDVFYGGSAEGLKVKYNIQTKIIYLI